MNGRSIEMAFIAGLDSDQHEGNRGFCLDRKYQVFASPIISVNIYNPVF